MANANTKWKFNEA